MDYYYGLMMVRCRLNIGMWVVGLVIGVVHTFNSDDDAGGRVHCE